MIDSLYECVHTHIFTYLLIYTFVYSNDSLLPLMDELKLGYYLCRYGDKVDELDRQIRDALNSLQGSAAKGTDAASSEAIATDSGDPEADITGV
jgi:hypothetical protein